MPLKRKSVKMPASREAKGPTASRIRRASSVSQLTFPNPPPVQATPNTRLRRFKKIRDKNLKLNAQGRNTMTDVLEVNEPSTGGSQEVHASNVKQNVSGVVRHSALSNGQSNSTESADDRVTNGVSNGVSHSLSSEEEQNASNSAVETFEVEEVTDRDLELEIYPEDVVGLNDGDDNTEYVVYEEVTESESGSSSAFEKLVTDRVEPEDEYKEFNTTEQHEEIFEEEVSAVLIPQPETVTEDRKIDTAQVTEPSTEPETGAVPTVTLPVDLNYKNPYAIVGRQPIRDIGKSSNRKRKAYSSQDSEDKKPRLNDSSRSGSSWSPGWRFWSVAAPSTPSEEGDSMFVNVDEKSSFQSFSTTTLESSGSSSASSWRKYCSLM